MLDFVNLSYELFEYLLFFLILTTIIIIAIRVIISIKKEIKLKMILFGLFQNISKKDIISVSINYIFFTLCLWCLIFNSEYVSILKDYHYYLIVSSLLIFDFLNEKIIKIFIDLFNSVMIFYIIFIKQGFNIYINSIANTIYLNFLYFIMIFFGILYIVVIFINNMIIVLNNHKYSKEKLNEQDN